MCFCHHICHQNCHCHHNLINCHHNCHQNHNFTRVTGTGTCASARRTSATLLLLRSEPALSLSLLLSSSADPSEWSRLGHGWGRERERGGRVQLCSCSDRNHQSCLLPCNPCSCLPQLILVREVDKDIEEDENKNKECNSSTQMGTSLVSSLATLALALLLTRWPKMFGKVRGILSSTWNSKNVRSWSLIGNLVLTVPLL